MAEDNYIGEWKNNDKQWTNKLRKEMDYPKNATNGEFCILVKDFLQ